MTPLPSQPIIARGRMKSMQRFLFLTLVSYQLLAANWPQWRGPSANGISPEKNVPIQWSPGENILWKIPLRGLGTSTPIVWGDRIFVTSQVGDGPFEQRGRDFDN